MSDCTSCAAPILWVWVGNARMPLDPEPVSFEQAGLVAFNPNTGGGKVLAATDLPLVGDWKSAGATLHRSHFATCPNAAQHRGAGSGQLDLLGGAAG